MNGDWDDKLISICVAVALLSLTAVLWTVLIRDLTR